MRRSSLVLIVAAIALIAGYLLLGSRGPNGPLPKSGSNSRESASVSGKQLSPSSAGNGKGSHFGNPKNVSERYRQAKTQFVAHMSRGLGEASFSKLHMEEVMGFTAARLLAALEPESTMAEAERTLSDAGGTEIERIFAIKVLGELAKLRVGAATDRLVAIAGSDDRMGAAALEMLVGADAAGSYRKLYQEYARKAQYPALDGISIWPDEASIALLMGIKAEGGGRPAPEGMFAYQAGVAAERGSLVRSGNWMEKVELILRKPEARKDEVRWAIRVLETQGKLPGSLEILSERLKVDEATAFLAREDANPASGSFGSETRDAAYDDLLLAYQRVGGKLSETQSARLRAFGYVGDAAFRLAELLRE